VINMSGISLDKETREMVTALAKRRKEAEAKEGTTFDAALAWCVRVGVKRQATLDRFAAAKKKERKAASKGGAKKGAKKAGAKKSGKAAKKAATKKPAKATKPKAAKKGGGKRSAKKSADAPVAEAAE
jgi:hypothetical protein